MCYLFLRIFIMYPQRKKQINKNLAKSSKKVLQSLVVGSMISTNFWLGFLTEDASAGHINSVTRSGISNSDFPPSPFPYTNPHWNGSTSSAPKTYVHGATCNHASWIVNWHHSSIPTLSWGSAINLVTSHYNMHSSWGWC